MLVFDRNSGAGDSASSLRRPTLVKRETKFDPAVEQKQIQEILGNLDDEDRDFLSEDPSYGSGIFRPIALHQGMDIAMPTLDDHKYSNVFSSTVESDIKPEQRLNASSQSASSSAVSYPQSLEEFFSRQQQQLFLLQVNYYNIITICKYQTNTHNNSTASRLPSRPRSRRGTCRKCGRWKRRLNECRSSN